MSITLKRIWSASPEDLQLILQTADRTLTGNLGYDRATVAIIYYNSGQLAPQDEKWVAWPGFVEAMSSSSSLEEGLKALKRPFVLLVLALYGSFSCGWSSAASNAGRAFGISAIDIAGEAAGSAAYDVVSNVTKRITGDRAIFATEEIFAFTITATTSSATYDAIENAAQLPGATPESIGMAAAEASWQAVIKRQSLIQDKIKRINLEDKDFNPIEIVNELLAVDLSPVIPKARCYYLYRIQQMLQVIPENTDLSEKFNTAVEKYGCDIILEHEPTEPLTEKGLGPLTSKVGEDAEKHLRALIGHLMGRPPTEKEVMHRLLALE